jgi:ectoine hydroxylase-related dioxygenase (phytanoyl-CoA dioxygenase family)
MRRDGAVVFDNLFPLPLLEKLRRDVLRRHESGQLRERGLVRDIGGRYAALIPFEGPFLDPRFYADPKLLEVIESLLGATRCIGSLEAVVAMPGAYRQHQHIDGPLRFDRTVGGSKRTFKGDLSDLPPYAVTLCVPLCAVDEQNGPTAIWPGSHRTALRARPPGEAEIARDFPVEHMAGPFGRAFLFDYRTFHGGTPNHTSEPRPVLMFVFTRSWFRDPNLTEVFPNVVITKRGLARVPERYKDLFMLAPAARRALWDQGTAGGSKVRKRS